MKRRLAIDFEWRDAELWMDGNYIARLLSMSERVIFVHSSYPGYQSHTTSPAVVYGHVPADVLNCMLVRLGS